jgi:hypothetical protein
VTTELAGAEAAGAAGAGALTAGAGDEVEDEDVAVLSWTSGTKRSFGASRRNARIRFTEEDVDETASERVAGAADVLSGVVETDVDAALGEDFEPFSSFGP